MAAKTDWRAHPLCGPRDTYPDRYWGPDRLDPETWRRFAALLDPTAEIAAILAALGDVTDVVDVGGGTGTLAEAIAARVPLIVIEPDPEQRAHAPAHLTVRAGRAEAVPIADGGADAAIATWVLQYTDDPDLAVAELARIARRRVVIVQPAPNNDLVEVYNREAVAAGMLVSHHGWLLARAAADLEAHGFAVTLEHVAIPLRTPPGGAPELADILSRMHTRDPVKRAAMVAATTDFIASRLVHGPLADDGVVLCARRDQVSSSV